MVYFDSEEARKLRYELEMEKTCPCGQRDGNRRYGKSR